MVIGVNYIFYIYIYILCFYGICKKLFLFCGARKWLVMLMLLVLAVIGQTLLFVAASLVD